jgi:hypothetical protein
MLDTTKYYEEVKRLAAKEKKLTEDCEYEYSDDAVEKDDFYEKETQRQAADSEKLAAAKQKEQKRLAEALNE